MGKSIDDYKGKRDFGKTPEPPPGDRNARRDAPVFVVHRHEARRLHYDLRIEMEGVLRSWAVPKGFSYDPGEKHLAVRTEDHPMEYEHFDGIIPAGQYGAGSMTIWDRGTYETVHGSDGARDVESGELKIRMRGRRLRGEWHLVKTKQGPDTWLLFKSKDRYAGPARDSAVGSDLAHATEAPLPRSLAAMQAGERAEPFSDPEWLFEMEFAGERAFAEKRGDKVRLRGQRAKLPELERALLELRAENALLDGVLVVLDENERPSRERLARRLAGESEDAVSYYAFDLVHYEEFDLRPLPLLDRKTALRAVLPPSTPLLYVDHVAGDGESLAAACAGAGLPGVVAKRAESPYARGRSADWQVIRVDAGADTQDVNVTEALGRAAKEPPRSKVKFTNLEKVFWPAEGYTKGDLIAYYEAVAEVLVPYLRERPVHMNRFPDGIEGKSFYQKDAKEAPDWIPTIPIETDSKDEPSRYMICNERDTLLYFANQGSIDLHPWLSRRDTLDSPDWTVLDLDPKEAPFSDVVKIARAAGRLLRGIGLRPLVKTSGATGIHVYVPLKPGYTYDQSRMFCEGVARAIGHELPDISTVERAIGSRAGKVYLDFGQNRAGQTVVPPYVPRPVKGATVSAPLDWDELDGDLSLAQFTIQTMPKRLAERGDLFRPALTDKQDLLPAIEALQEHLRDS